MASGHGGEQRVLEHCLARFDGVFCTRSLNVARIISPEHNLTRKAEQISKNTHHQVRTVLRGFEESGYHPADESELENLPAPFDSILCYNDSYGGHFT